MGDGVARGFRAAKGSIAQSAEATEMLARIHETHHGVPPVGLGGDGENEDDATPGDRRGDGQLGLI